LDGLAADVRAGGGSAFVCRVEEPDDTSFASLFDRSEDYALLLAEVAKAHEALTASTAHDTTKLVRKLRKTFVAITETDFFSGEAQRQADSRLYDLERAIAQILSPDEPHNRAGDIQPRRIGHYQGRIWATRQRPWVDRLASAWLIRRFIDPQARIMWLASPTDCPLDALGFDFDGATFSHVGSRVTFEVLLASFALEQPALARLGLLVHFLDVGGVCPSEAAGVESVLAGLRRVASDDDEFLAHASTVFDGLLSAFDTRTQGSQA
jgi:hypothetical protein